MDSLTPRAQPPTPDVSKHQEQLEVKIEIARLEHWAKYRDMRLKAIKSGDREMFALSLDSISEEELRSEQSWREDIAIKGKPRDDMFVLLAWHKGEVVGVSRVKSKGEGVWHAEFTYIEKDFRGKGIEQKMLDMQSDEIKRRNER